MRFLALVVALAAQAVPATFEVASVKPHDRANPRAMMVADASGRFTAVGIPIVVLIRTTYNLQDDQVVGGPDWLRTARFDITAKAPDGTSPTTMGPMLQALLADRFQLTSHRETRELPVFAAVKARGDGQLGPRLVANGCVWDFTKPPAPPKPGETRCGNISESVGRLSLNAMPIPAFLQYLAPKVNRVIVDRTGLTGNFDIELRWAPDDGQAIDPNMPSLFTALQEQLGLKLEATRAPVEVLVVDRLEQPSPD